MADKEQVIQALRATLISVKGALTIKQCNRDYKELQGEWIPYKRLGYSSLEKLFIDIPGFKVTQINGEWYVDAIASQETQHIASMVAKQKSTKKPPAKYPSRFPKRQGSWRKPVSYTPNYNNQYSNQYYRAKGDSTPFNNNYKNVKHNYKTNEPKQTNSAPVKQQLKQSNSKDYNTNSKDDRRDYNTNSKDDRRDYNTNSKDDRRDYNTNSKDDRRDYNTNSKDDRRDYNSNSKMKNSIPMSLPSHQDATTREEYNLPSRVSNNENNEKSVGKMSASQRLSNLRDRLNTVDCIPLQLPAASNDTCVDDPNHIENNIIPKPTGAATEIFKRSLTEISGAVTHVAPAHDLEPPPDTSSSAVKLEWMCKKLGMQQPVYKVHNMPSKHASGSYCSVKVPSTTYSATSYPSLSPSEEMARELAAAKLLAEFESAEAGGLPTAEPAAALASLADLVAECEAGLWATTVPQIYRQKYGENLPSNWQELVENCPRIIKDRLVNGLFVLLPNKGQSSTRTREPLSPAEDLESELPMLQFPEEMFWNVQVTVPNSPIEIWIRIIGPEHSGQLMDLLTKMNEYYEHDGTSVDRSMLIKNGWYAVHLAEAGWHRAKVLDIHESSVTVFLGDHGDDDVVPIQHLRILEPQFRKLPAQGVLCRLEGAEELAAHPQGVSLVQSKMSNGKALVAAPGPRTDPYDPAVPLVLYDTSTQHDINLNKEIVEDFCLNGAFSLTQKPCEVEVGCVTEEGRVWVARAGGAATVRAALDLLTAGPYRRPLPPAPPAPPPLHHALYIVRTLAGDWVRCCIISGLDGEGTVRTQLVDSGLILRAPLSSLVPLQTFSPALNAYPRQAVQVRLGAAERAAGGMVPRLRELLLGARVVCRALPAPAPAPAPAAPHVELFVRTGPQNILASVNNAILMEFDYLQLGKMKEEAPVSTNTVEALNKKKERIFRSVSAGGADERGAALPPPALPALGMCFDVHVAMAANPWNFVVQPNSTRNTLQTMMATLQAECPKLSEADAPASPASGELYTVFYEKDRSWYRVTVAGCVSTEMVSVYFCDYGDLALFACKDLRPVPPAAPLARSLPPQALKARLYDVWPLHQDWTVEDCVRFQELCVEQQFVGICKEIGKDPLNPNEPLLTLDLIDTTTDEDVYLNKQLVAERRARLSAEP